MMKDIQNKEVSPTPLLRVVDFTRRIPGPVATRLLTDLGASVIRVERPGNGDGTRAMAPFIHDRGLFHVALSGGIRSLSLGRRSPHWPRVIKACVQWADAVIVGGLPDSLRKLGVDFETLVAHNPRLVHCNLTGYGEHGPLSTLPAHGVNPDAYAGQVPIDYPSGQPEISAHYQSAGSPLSGVFAALGVLAALRRRDATGEPQRISVSLFGAALWWNWRHVVSVANTGRPWWNYRDFGGRYMTYRTKDEKVILVCPIEQPFWEAFCDELGLPQEWRSRGWWGEKSHVDHGVSYPWEKPVIAEAIAKQTLEYWTAAFTRINIPFAPILSLEDALAGEHVRATGALRTVRVNGRDAKIPALPIEFASDRLESNAKMRLKTPDIGEHNAEILREIGLSGLSV